jgi:hypothetical protein
MGDPLHSTKNRTYGRVAFMIVNIDLRSIVAVLGKLASVLSTVGVTLEGLRDFLELLVKVLG